MARIANAEGPLLEQILDDTWPIWNEGLNRPAYGRYFTAQLATPWGRDHLRRVALVEDGGALARAKISELAATAGGAPLRVAGIGAVFTAPAHRRSGAARDLVTAILDRARADGADVALLFSEIGPDYYAR